MSNFFDINAFDPVADSKAGAWMHANDPYDFQKKLYADAEQTLPVEFHVLGPETEEVRDLITDINRRFGNGEADAYDPEKCAACVTGWRNIGVGKDTACTAANVVTVLTKFNSFKLQIATYAMTLKNFKGSANKA